ncbi:unnamed protein product [Trifolium pratense]|uniref:Uncharacterized protein n=1 Tax=Trifolium pratense TaxID=57577 RepID=A0ACB0LGV5_TRIPR|nr:unnamed protein product [Trifolium pratense]
MGRSQRNQNQGKGPPMLMSRMIGREEKNLRGRTTEDTIRKKEHSKDKGEHKSRRREASDHDRHKRRRSSSVSSRGRTSKDHSHANELSGEGSDGSKRMLRSRKRDLSPSPVRSKRRVAVVLERLILVQYR